MASLILDAAEDPFSPLSRQLGRIIEELASGHYVRFSRTESWRPSLNMYETHTHYLICVELGGMPREEIDVRAEADRIVIRGHRSDPVPPRHHESICVHMMEIDSGPFCREIRLPSPIDVDGISATYREGLLWVHAPKQTR